MFSNVWIWIPEHAWHSYNASHRTYVKDWNKLKSAVANLFDKKKTEVFLLSNNFTRHDFFLLWIFSLVKKCYNDIFLKHQLSKLSVNFLGAVFKLYSKSYYSNVVSSVFLLLLFVKNYRFGKIKLFATNETLSWISCTKQLFLGLKTK